MTNFPPYCSDEDVCTLAPSDFPSLAPSDQVIVQADDGAVSSSDPWTLTSATAPFATSGLAPGHIVQITGPRTSQNHPGDMFAVVSVGTHGVTLRRRGQAAGMGQPLSLTTIADISFTATTLAPQIAAACLDLDRRFGVNDRWLGRRHTDLFDPTELRDAAVYSTLAATYLEISRGTGEMRMGTPDAWQVKADRYADLLDDLVARLSVTWKAYLDGNAPGSSSQRWMRVGR